MKISNIILGLATLCLMVFSCTKPELSEPVILADIKGKLQSISELRDNILQKKTSFRFDPKGRPIEITIEDVINELKTVELINLDSLGLPISSEISRTTSSGSLKLKREYTYGEKGLITQIKETNSTDKKEYYEFYTYNEQGRVVEFLSRQIEGGSNKFAGSMSLTWQGEKLSTIETRGASGEFEETSYLLDEFKNPLFGIYANDLKIPIANPNAISPDNIKFYQTLFEGKKYQREALADSEGNTTHINISVFENSQWKPIGQIIYEYY